MTKTYQKNMLKDRKPKNQKPKTIKLKTKKQKPKNINDQKIPKNHF